MAKSSSNGDFKVKIAWIAGGAVVSAVAIYYVNSYMKEREDYKRLSAAERTPNPGLPENSRDQG